MIFDGNTAEEIALKLLEINAIKLSPEKPFTWASGWKSPIYCDNRKTLSYPRIRTLLKNSFCNLIQNKFPEVEAIAGVATAGIPHGALIANELDLPFVYVRSSAKDHGLKNLIEGELTEGSQVVVVEDLISTGKSSMAAVEALKDAGAEIIGLVAIFTYNFPIASLSFAEAHIPVYTLSDYDTLVNISIKKEYIQPSELQSLQAWKKDPAVWQL